MRAVLIWYLICKTARVQGQSVCRCRGTDISAFALHPGEAGVRACQGCARCAELLLLLQASS